jgi:DNA-3-methyladenine glycosylase
LGRAFYSRPATQVAPELLNKVIVSGGCAGRIVEVEAYCGGDDPGSHAFRGPTPRTETMFGPPGRLYVYFTYGMHWCANVVVDRDGTAAAVLVRALTPLRGLDEMTGRRRAAPRRRDLCSGPAKLTQALAIDGTHDGVDLVRAERNVTIVDDGIGPPTQPGRSTRIGLTKGVDLRWRWFVPEVEDVSRPPGSSRRARSSGPSLG